MPPRGSAIPQPPSILIVRPSALGDVCRTVPVLVSLRRAFPDARIDWLVQDTFTAAIEAHPDLTEAIAFPRQRLAGVGNVPAAIGWLNSIRRRRYDTVFDFQGLGRSGLMTWWSGARRRIGDRHAREFGWLGYNERHRLPPANATHTVDRMLALLEAAGVEPVRDMRLYVSEEDRRWWWERQPDRYAVLAPTARWVSKRWPIERWAALIEPLLMRGFSNVVIVGGPGEREQVEALWAGGRLREAASGDGPLIDLVGATNVGQTMAVIADAGLVVANDSAPLHMAVGFDVPCVGLFGPTDPRLVGPYLREHSALRMFTPSPGETVHYRDAKLGDRLMRVISTAAVIQRIDTVLAGPHVISREASHISDVRSHISSLKPPIYLASASPRRKLLLEGAGFEPIVLPPDIDDAKLQHGKVSPEDWVTALAYLKARRVADRLRLQQPEAAGAVLGADTVCVCDEAILGQPRDADDARRMVLAMRGRSHRTITGVCLIDLETNRRTIFHDAAEVRIGEVSDEQVERYIASGEWRGKAGAYNLSERINDGWPIECVGDPSTVMGLPMQRLMRMLPMREGAAT